MERDETNDGTGTNTGTEPAKPKRDPSVRPEGATMLTKLQIVNADDTVREYVEVPEWGGWVLVRGLTAGERSKLEARMLRQQRDGSQKVDAKEMRQLFCAYGIIDEQTGGRMFSDTEISLVANKSAAATDRVYEAISRLSRVSESDIAELEGE
jgi:hypothetical protein